MIFSVGPSKNLFCLFKSWAWTYFGKYLLALAAKTASGLKCRFEMRRRRVHWMWDDTLDMCAI